jgi:hypothetical protein
MSVSVDGCAFCVKDIISVRCVYESACVCASSCINAFARGLSVICVNVTY